MICHPKLVETGLDLLDFSIIILYESGHSLHTLRQAGRKSGRIGEHRSVRAQFLCYEGTMQTSGLRLLSGRRRRRRSSCPEQASFFGFS